MKHLANNDFNANKLENVPAPINDSDAANKKYVDDNQVEVTHYNPTAFRYYVKGTTGSDTNDGLTAETAFKTLERAFSQYNKGETDFRVNLSEAGTYTLTGFNIVGAGLHLSALVPGVTLNIDSLASSFAFYDVHVNLKGVDASNRLNVTGTPFHLDSADMVATYCNFSQKIRSYSSGVRFDNCGITELYGENATVNLESTDVLNTDPSITPFYLVNCLTKTIGAYTTANLSSTGSVPMFYVAGGQLSMESGFFTTLTNKYTYAWELHEAVLLINANRYLDATMVGSSRVSNDESLIQTGPLSGVSGISYGSGFSATSVSLSKVGNIATLSGFFTKSSAIASGDTILTVPAGWRPFEVQYVSAASATGGKTGRVDVNFAGLCTIRNPSSAMNEAIFSVTYFVGG